MMKNITGELLEIVSDLKIETSLDESFDGLDPGVRQTVRELLIEYMADTGASVIMASHNLYELEGVCDTIGLLVLQDMPSDVPERRFGAEVGFGPDTFRFAFHRQDWKRVMDHLHNVPSIVMWVPYNEGWGQPTTEFLTHATLDWTKRRDPSRLVNGPSGWNDFEGGRHALRVDMMMEIENK